MRKNSTIYSLNPSENTTIDAYFFEKTHGNKKQNAGY